MSQPPNSQKHFHGFSNENLMNPSLESNEIVHEEMIVESPHPQGQVQSPMGV